MKTLSPTLERLEERVAPDLMGSIGIGVIIGIGGQVGVGGGTSACNYSGSSCDNSSRDTCSGTCYCGRNSH